MPNFSLILDVKLEVDGVAAAMDHELIQAIPGWRLAPILVQYGVLVSVFALRGEATTGRPSDHGL